MWISFWWPLGILDYLNITYTYIHIHIHIYICAGVYGFVCAHTPLSILYILVRDATYISFENIHAMIYPHISHRPFQMFRLLALYKRNFGCVNIYIKNIFKIRLCILWRWKCFIWSHFKWDIRLCCFTYIFCFFSKMYCPRNWNTKSIWK